MFLPFPLLSPSPSEKKRGGEGNDKKNEIKHEGVNRGRERGDGMISRVSVEPKTRAIFFLAKDSILYTAGGEREKKPLSPSRDVQNMFLRGWRCFHCFFYFIFLYPVCN